MNWYTHVQGLRARPSRIWCPTRRAALALGFFGALMWGDSAWPEESRQTVIGPSLNPASAQVAPPILQLTVVPNSRKVDTLALHKLQFKLSDTLPLPLDAGFRVTYPAGFGLESLLTVLYADSDLVIPNPKFSQPLVRSGQSADFFLDSTGTATQPGAWIVLNLLRIRNFTLKGIYQIALEILGRDSTLLYGPTLSAPFSLSPGAADTISVTPSVAVSVAAGRSLLFAATVRDVYDNVIDTATVSWRVEPDTLGLQSGAIFTARRVGTGKVIAQYGTLVAESGQITVRPGTLASWEVQGMSPSGVAGTGLPGDSVVVTARDAFGNLKTDYVDSLYFSSTDPSAQLPATAAAPFLFTSADLGRHAFAAADFIFFRAGIDTIFVTGGGKSTLMQIAVSAASAVDFAVGAPATVTAGVPFAVSATSVRDLYGNPAGGTLSLYLHAADSISPSGQPPLLPELQAAGGSGIVNVRLHKSGTYPIFASVGDSIRWTDSIFVRPAAATQLDLAIAEPQFSSIAFLPPSTITAVDPFGNLDLGYALSGRTVTVSAQNGDPMTGNSFAATAFSLGTADLSGLGVTYSGRGGQVTFLATDGLAQGTSTPVDVVALTVDTVAFDQTEVRRGVDVLSGTIVLRMEGVGKASISGLSLETSFGSFPLSTVVPQLPDSLMGPGTTGYDFTWPVDGALPQACVPFGARVLGSFGADAVTAEFSGGPCLSVVSAAEPTLATLSPDTVAYAPVRYLANILNDGIRGVTLELAYTRLLISDSAGRIDTVRAETRGQVFLYPESSLVIAFAGTHGAPFAGDSAFATLEMRGYESGRPFAASTWLPDALQFRSPADVVYVPGTFSADTLLLGRAATLHLRLANTGGVPIDKIRPESTWIALWGILDTARLPLNVTATPLSRLAAGTDTLLAFELSAVEARLAGGTYQARLLMVGEQNHLYLKSVLELGQSVDLVGEARVRIDSVWITAPNAPHVSAGQSFLVSATISNQGLEPVDSVELALSATAGALFTSEAQITTIPQGDSRTAQWPVIADFVPVSLETFAVNVSRAVGRFTRVPAQVVPALDPQAAVQVQAPAEVRVEVEVYLPPEAADFRVAAGSDFQIAARFVNLGEAETGGGALRVAVTGGLVVAESTVVTLPPAGDALWNLTAPPADTSAQIVVSLEGTVDELNTSGPAAVAKSADTLEIEVAFEAPPLLVYDVQFGGGQIGTEFNPLRWGWKNADPSGQFPILLEKLEIEMIAGRSGAPLNAADYLTSAELEMAGSAVAATFSGGRLSFGQDSLRRIAPGDSEQVVLRVVPKGGPDFSEYRFATRSALWSAVERFVNGAGLTVPVVDERGQSLNIQSPLAFQSGTAPANYPNPFRAGVENTQIVYTLTQDAQVGIVLFAADGREVWSYEAPAGTPGGSAGANAVIWDGRNVDGRTVFDGVYFARIQGGGLDATLKIAVLK